MARLKSEIEVACPCCHAVLVIDTNLGRVVSHQEPERGNKPELSNAHGILAAEAERREAIFQQSVSHEKTRGDALSRRFEEALKQANQEPIRCRACFQAERDPERRQRQRMRELAED